MVKIKEGFKGERSLVVPKMIIDYMEKDPYLCGLHITDIGYYPHAKHHYRQRLEPIDQYIFIYCTDGEGWYEMNGAHFDIQANQFFIIPANTPHSYGADDDNPWTIYWMHFNGTLAHMAAQGMHVPHSIDAALNSRINDRIQLFEEMFYSLSASYSRENIHYANSILHHFFGSLHYVSQFRDAAQRAEVSSGEKCKQAIHFMQENIGGHITLQQLADFTGYTPNHFATIFKRSIGHAPLTYFNLLKMQAAAEMLDATSLRINQIASKLGYEDTGYFTRLFTKIMGVSPKAYRLTLRG